MAELDQLPTSLIDSQRFSFSLKMFSKKKEASSSPLVLSISRIPVAAGLLFDMFEEIGVTHVAVVVLA